MHKNLFVYMNGLFVGTWEQTPSLLQSFTYDQTWLHNPKGRAISLSLPLSEITYKGKVVASFFENLLPESEAVRRKLQNRFKTSSIRAFELLEEIGRDCVGALQIVPKPMDKTSLTQKIEGTLVKEHEIAHILRKIQGLESNNSTISATDFRISVSGAQEKTAFLRYQGQWMIPKGVTPTTHIFKLPIGKIQDFIDFSDSIENEWLSNHIAGYFGMPVCNSTIQSFEEQKVLVVERFDREWSQDQKQLIRLPQEDLCQALGCSPDQKYQSDGGPGILEIMKLLQGSNRAEEDRDLFFKSQVLSYLMAAPDAHAKNFSLALGRRGSFRLTPFYDIMSAYPLFKKTSSSLDPKKLTLAMGVYGKSIHYRWDSITRRYWLETGLRAGLSSDRVERILEGIVNQVPTVIDMVYKNLPSEFPNYIADSICEGMEKTAQNLTK
ncbi:HipA domain-containing protein [Sphaerochaeta pleomorpha str. Grapes]|uniref:HipA domain-containing protein n=1 Tax=Sphaerochaeta pleomorpha (strain ATCC BAA-1885 / DSM 22778 / Grapes) TaxID=158190 RepID=G8QX18_SPHPG|nr:type II toxin-antitoxin system HipA family toxin [Sphaerochaeta pleomorpha]AEV29522.1 HipA domain-containing protein [Sphaerochaeta pleomorpha str. Grapes]